MTEYTGTNAKFYLSLPSVTPSSPKLLSGELRVGQAEKVVEET